MAKTPALSSEPFTEEQPPPEQPSYRVLWAARKLLAEGKITLKDLAARMNTPPRSLAAMLQPGYENISITRVDQLKSVVREVKSK